MESQRMEKVQSVVDEMFCKSQVCVYIGHVHRRRMNKNPNPLSTRHTHILLLRSSLVLSKSFVMAHNFFIHSGPPISFIYHHGSCQ